MAYNPNNSNGQKTMANSSPVVVASDQSAVPVSISGNQAVNLTQVSNTTTDTNSGNKSAGTLRVVLATDQPQLTNKLLVTPDANSAVNVAQVGGNSVSTSANGVANVTVIPGTANGLTTYHLVSAATTNATNIKNAAGQVYGWYIYNSNAAARKVAFHNSASAPTAGASIFFTLMIPPTSAANVEFTNGIAFSSGIGISTVTGLADNDTTAVAANDLIINIFYK